jgi:Methyltransferase domain
MSSWMNRIRSAIPSEPPTADKTHPSTFAGADPETGWDARKNERLIGTLKTRAEITRLVRPGGVGIELGVAHGVFSELILRTSHFSYLYSIDAYGDRKHPIAKYQAALVRLAPHRARNALIRMRFDEALSLFPDEYFDFIYVDGCAGNGEEDGQSFYDWWPKVRRGGVFAGHDYSPEWPRVMQAADRFVADKGVRLFTVGGEANPEDVANRYASWLAVRPVAHTS